MGWPIYVIGDVCKVISGGTPKSGILEYWDGEVNWITPKDMGQLEDVYVSVTSRTISEKGLSKSSAKLVPANSVILSTRAPIGHLAINSVPMATNQGCRGLVPDQQKLTTKYLFYYLLSKVDLLNELGSGTTFKELSKTALEKVSIPVPGLNEQKRIVAMLDEAFEDIDKARELTEQNLKNARELFESYLDKAINNSSSSWVTEQLRNLTTKIGSGATPRGGKATYKKEGIALIRSLNVYDRKFKPENLALIDDDQAEKLQNVTLKSGDVLLNITGASVARCCIVPTSAVPGRVNQHVSILRCKQNQLLPEFLLYALTSKFYKNQLLGIGEAGSTRQAITKAQLESFTISFPRSTDEQKQVVEELKTVERHVESIYGYYSVKLDSLNELKQLLLHQALNGRLRLTEIS